MEQINLNRFPKSKVSNARLPRKIQLQENNPVATYRVTPTIKKN